MERGGETRQYKEEVCRKGECNAKTSHSPLFAPLCVRFCSPVCSLLLPCVCAFAPLCVRCLRRALCAAAAHHTGVSTSPWLSLGGEDTGACARRLACRTTARRWKPTRLRMARAPARHPVSGAERRRRHEVAIITPCIQAGAGKERRPPSVRGGAAALAPHQQAAPPRVPARAHRSFRPRPPPPACRPVPTLGPRAALGVMCHRVWGWWTQLAAGVVQGRQRKGRDMPRVKTLTLSPRFPHTQPPPSPPTASWRHAGHHPRHPPTLSPPPWPTVRQGGRRRLHGQPCARLALPACT